VKKGQVMRERTILRLQAHVKALRIIHEDENEFCHRRGNIIPEELCDDESLAETDRLVDDLQSLENIITMLDGLSDR
jgi:hypothetical protein